MSAESLKALLGSNCQRIRPEVYINVSSGRITIERRPTRQRAQTAQVPLQPFNRRSVFRRGVELEALRIRHTVCSTSSSEKGEEEEQPCTNWILPRNQDCPNLNYEFDFFLAYFFHYFHFFLVCFQINFVSLQWLRG